MKSGLRRFLQKGLFLLAFVWGMSIACPMDARAQLNSLARLVVEDQTIVEDGVVNKDKITLSDGMGGTIVYSEVDNTLIIDNYTFTKLGRNDTFISSDLMSEYQMFRIVLVGTSTMIRPLDKREWSGKVECFSIELGNDAIIEGDGKLIANTAIGGSAYNFLIKDCDLEVNGLYFGIICDYLTLQNANVSLTTESLNSAANRSCAAALYVGGADMMEI